MIVLLLDGLNFNLGFLEITRLSESDIDKDFEVRLV